MLDQKSSHTVPHAPLLHTSTRPSLAKDPVPTNLRSPVVQAMESENSQFISCIHIAVSQNTLAENKKKNVVHGMNYSG